MDERVGDETPRFGEREGAACRRRGSSPASRRAGTRREHDHAERHDRVRHHRRAGRPQSRHDRRLGPRRRARASRTHSGQCTPTAACGLALGADRAAAPLAEDVALPIRVAVAEPGALEEGELTQTSVMVTDSSTTSWTGFSRLVSTDSIFFDDLAGLLVGDLAEDRVGALQPRRRHRADEELRAVRATAGLLAAAFAIASRYGLPNVRSGWISVVELVAGAADALTERVAALDHEVADDAVEDRAVVERSRGLLAGLRVGPLDLALGEPGEVRNRLRCVVSEQVDPDVPQAGLEGRDCGCMVSSSHAVTGWMPRRRPTEPVSGRTAHGTVSQAPERTELPQGPGRGPVRQPARSARSMRRRSSARQDARRAATPARISAERARGVRGSSPSRLRGRRTIRAQHRSWRERPLPARCRARGHQRPRSRRSPPSRSRRTVRCGMRSAARAGSARMWAPSSAS